MADKDDNDIIIAIASTLKKASAADGECTIHFPSIEENWELPAGSVEKHLDAAAEDAGLEVVRRGSTRASFRKRGGAGAGIVRS